MERTESEQAQEYQDDLHYQKEKPVEEVAKQVEIAVTLEELYSGVTKEVTKTISVACFDCEGTGAKGATALSTCNECKGSGEFHI
jgi:DnaJ-class molecular chaperone